MFPNEDLMATDTDIRLRSALDGNQRDREQMCRSVVALDRRYDEVVPRHPLGGPDGGRDIECRLRGETVAYGAVGFLNGANDSDEQRKKIRQKFTHDLASAKAAKLDLRAFVFLTNVRLPQGEQTEMKRQAQGQGVTHCDILDRERLRIELDSPAGFFIRFQYLGIPLSEAEQASFLSRYGDQIQQVVTTGFQRIERTLNRLLFLQEARGELGYLHFRFNLNRVYTASEIGHFRAFISLFLNDVQRGVLSIWFGSTDKANRFRTDFSKGEDDPSGIADGIATGAWERRIRMPKEWEDEAVTQEPNGIADHSVEEDVGITTVQVNSSSGMGMHSVHAVSASYRSNDDFIRFRAGLTLLDLDNCMYLPIVNESFAQKIESIEVFAGAYRVAHIECADFRIDRTSFEVEKTPVFSDDELMDQWVRLRPSRFSSAFQINFGDATPTRRYGHEEVVGPNRP